MGQTENGVYPEYLVFLVPTAGLALLALKVPRVFEETIAAYVPQVKINYNL